MNYIIDFERVNELTTTKQDNPKEGYSGTYQYGICRKMISMYLEIYHGDKVSNECRNINMDTIIDTLVYNRILITKGQLREEKINTILND